jgi:SAM-dependent methyltransferase
MGIRSAQGNLSELPLHFGDGDFDILICCEVVEHLNFNPLPVFLEFNRLLKTDGILYIGTPNQANIVKRIMLARGKSVNNSVQDFVWQLNPDAAFSIGLHWREYTAVELVQLLQLTGFELAESYFCRTNEKRNPNPIRRVLVDAMYGCFPAFLPSQVAIGVKKVNPKRPTVSGI